MKHITVATKTGDYITFHSEDAPVIDPVENSLVIVNSAGRVRFYWPNVLYVLDMEESE